MLIKLTWLHSRQTTCCLSVWDILINTLCVSPYTFVDYIYRYRTVHTLPQCKKNILVYCALPPSTVQYMCTSLHIFDSLYLWQHRGIIVQYRGGGHCRRFVNLLSLSPLRHHGWNEPASAPALLIPGLEPTGKGKAHHFRYSYMYMYIGGRGGSYFVDLIFLRHHQDRHHCVDVYVWHILCICVSFACIFYISRSISVFGKIHILMCMYVYISIYMYILMWGIRLSLQNETNILTKDTPHQLIQYTLLLRCAQQSGPKYKQLHLPSSLYCTIISLWCKILSMYT